MSEQHFPAGPAPRVRITRLKGDLHVTVWDEEAIAVGSDAVIRELYLEDDEVCIGECDADLELHLPARTVLHLTAAEGDVHLNGLRVASLERVAGDVSIAALGERLEVGRVGGDVQIDADGLAIRLSDIRGDLTIRGAATLHAGQIGGDCTLTGVQRATVQLGNVGGDLRVGPIHALRVANVGGDLVVEYAGASLAVGNVGGDVRLGRVEGDFELGAVGGDLYLAASLAPGCHGRAQVAGDVRLSLPEAPDLTLRAMVGGDVRGGGTQSSGGPHSLNLRYGAGAASLDVTVAGDLRISGGGTAEESAWAWGEASGATWAEFGREMGELGRELGRLGHELGEELAAAFGAVGQPPQNPEESSQRGQTSTKEQAPKARLNLRVNEREWQLDPERLERIKEQARQAAAEGLAGALEAVERAVGRMRVAPAAPPVPPTPPVPPAPVTGQTIRIEAEPVAVADPTPVEAPPLDREQEHESILHMIAAGRISPEEGDMLLEALGE